MRSFCTGLKSHFFVPEKNKKMAWKSDFQIPLTCTLKFLKKPSNSMPLGVPASLWPRSLRRCQRLRPVTYHVFPQEPQRWEGNGEDNYEAIHSGFADVNSTSYTVLVSPSIPSQLLGFCQTSWMNARAAPHSEARGNLNRSPNHIQKRTPLHQGPRQLAKSTPKWQIDGSFRIFFRSCFSLMEPSL